VKERKLKRQKQKCSAKDNPNQKTISTWEKEQYRSSSGKGRKQKKGLLILGNYKWVSYIHGGTEQAVCLTGRKNTKRNMGKNSGGNSVRDMKNS
jgi:hypothetical protein